MKLFTALCLAIFSGIFIPLASATDANTHKSPVLFGELSVSATNDEWTATSVKVKEGELLVIFVREDSRVSVGKFLGTTDANGTRDGIGALQIKIGSGSASVVGTNRTVITSDSGYVKFKIFDTNYSDNSGQFEVFVIHLSDSAMPSKPVNISQEN